MSGNESTIWIVKSGNEVTNCHLPGPSGNDVTFWTLMSGNELTICTLYFANELTICTLPCKLHSPAFVHVIGGVLSSARAPRSPDATSPATIATVRKNARIIVCPLRPQYPSPRDRMPRIAPRDSLRRGHRGTCTRRVARVIGELFCRADVGLARATQTIEPLKRHAPVPVLVRAHVMIVVPREVLASPRGIDVAASMIAPILREQVPRRRRVERRDRQERRVREPDEREPDRFAELRRRAPHRTFEVRIVAAVSPDLLMMRMKVKREDAGLVAPAPVQQVAMRGPLAVGEAGDRERDADHASSVRRSMKIVVTR